YYAQHTIHYIPTRRSSDLHDPETQHDFDVTPETNRSARRQFGERFLRHEEHSNEKRQRDDALTGSGLPNERASAMRAGCDRHMRSEEHTSELQSPDHYVCR